MVPVQRVHTAPLPCCPELVMGTDHSGGCGCRASGLVLGRPHDLCSLMEQGYSYKSNINKELVACCFRDWKAWGLFVTHLWKQQLSLG